MDDISVNIEAENIGAENMRARDVEEIVIEYRRGNPVIAPDILAIELCEDLIQKLKDLSEYNISKSSVLKGIDNVLYLLIHSLSLTIFVLGLYNGTESQTQPGGVSKWFYISSTLAAVSAFLTEISKRYNFRQRSIEIYKCVQNLQTYILELEKLKISPDSAEEKIDKIKTIELEIQPIQLQIFDNQITNEIPKKINLST